MRSRTDSRFALAIQRRFCDGDAVMSIEPTASGPDRDLLHVDARAGVEHRAPLGDGDDGDRVALAERGQGGAVDRVDGDVGERLRSVSDELAVEQHRSFVLLTLADDDDAAHRDGRQHRSHCFDRRPIGTDLVAPPDPS